MTEKCTLTFQDRKDKLSIMLKKILTIFILLTLVISFVPQEAFCSDHVDFAPVHHDCAFNCHACFHVIASAAVVEAQVFLVTIFKIRDVFSYQNPVISRLKRPPIQLS